MHKRSVWPACCFTYSEQVPGTFIPLFLRFIFCAHEFRARWITVTGWKREEEEEEECEADVERRSGERGENKGKRPGGIACWPAIKHSSCSATRHILTPGFSLILASYCFILSPSPWEGDAELVRPAPTQLISFSFCGRSRRNFVINRWTASSSVINDRIPGEHSSLSFSIKNAPQVVSTLLSTHISDVAKIMKLIIKMRLIMYVKLSNKWRNYKVSCGIKMCMSNIIIKNIIIDIKN